MKILVTGGAGYVGSVLVPSLLGKGFEVAVVDDLRLGGHGLLSSYGHPRFAFHKESVLDYGKMLGIARGHDVVIHLAALVGEPPCVRYPDEARRVNVDGVRTMAEASREAGVSHFIFSSTCSNYGKQPGGELDEEAPLVPLSLYAETKIESEGIVLSMNEPSFVTTVFRFATAFGVSPRMRFDTMLNEFVRDAVVDRWLLVYGKESYRTLVHVRDIVQMVYLTINMRERVAGEVFNVGSGHISKQGLAELVHYHVPTMEIGYKEQQSDPRDYRASFDKATRLGYSPRYTIEDGVREVAQALSDGLFLDPHSHLYRNVQ